MLTLPCSPHVAPPLVAVAGGFHRYHYFDLTSCLTVLSSGEISVELLATIAVALGSSPLPLPPRPLEPLPPSIPSAKGQIWSAAGIEVIFGKENGYTPIFSSPQHTRKLFLYYRTCSWIDLVISSMIIGDKRAHTLI